MPNQFIIHQLRVPADYSYDDLLRRLSRKIRIPRRFIEHVKITSRSIDARKNPTYVLSLVFSLVPSYNKTTSRLQQYHPPSRLHIPAIPPAEKPPIVIGAGPAGLAAAYVLAEAGTCPVILEQGPNAEVRQKDILQFWKEGILNPYSNMLFGRGSWPFSDGKLTCRSKNRREVAFFLDLLIDAGAPPSIRVDTHPHIGTDVLMKIIPRIRKKIEQRGGVFLFNTALKDMRIVDNRLIYIDTAEKTYPVDTLFLATGHSARDVYSLLHEKGVPLGKKGIAMGVRAELPQSLLNTTLYKAKTPVFGPAEFRVRRRSEKTDRSVYSFCMCPGGVVVSCASSAGKITTNGMSYSKRNLYWGNAAFLVPLSHEEYGGDAQDVLAGIRFQERWEAKAFVAGGKTYALPGSTLADFLENRAPTTLPPSPSAFRVTPANLRTLLPSLVQEALCETLPGFLHSLGQDDFSQVILYGVETRSSSPVQILRNSTGESRGVDNLYPLGEGAGYAGGIVSSGVDGIRRALQFLERREQQEAVPANID
ncbi:NAD(P)/FAD-dependent oxidoreductase [Chitinivibrio alkaliphilus]|uniref:Uncharacterized protein n=1 Tax=Chitinivibrio alkaliphilus ACht1 TaxID=1313304 RepID=U7DBB6_9BACT|nr:FAD-binding protein [Chitinivibrio alkaliphilus]ERP39302.1 hypothetical protein CALK_0095 [Chitinivibrio alkaliphilus ACht1]